MPESFPNTAVIKAYREAKVDQNKDKFTYGRPDLQLLRRFCLDKFNWQQDRADELLVPVLKVSPLTAPFGLHVHAQGLPSCPATSSSWNPLASGIVSCMSLSLTKYTTLVDVCLAQLPCFLHQVHEQEHRHYAASFKGFTFGVGVMQPTCIFRGHREALQANSACANDFGPRRCHVPACRDHCSDCLSSSLNALCCAHKSMLVVLGGAGI